MSEDEVSGWTASVIRGAQDQVRSVLPYWEVSRGAAATIQSMSPALQRAYAQQAQGAAATVQLALPALQRAYALQHAGALEHTVKMVNTMRPIIELAQLYGNLAYLETHWYRRRRPLVPAWAGEVSVAMNSGLVELARRAARQPDPQDVTATADLAAAPAVTVVVEPDPVPVRPVEHATQVRLIVFALVVVWLLAVSVPAAQLLLPQEAQKYMTNLWPTVAIAVAVSPVINSKRKP